MTFVLRERIVQVCAGIRKGLSLCPDRKNPPLRVLCLALTKQPHGVDTVRLFRVSTTCARDVATVSFTDSSDGIGVVELSEADTSQGAEIGGRRFLHSGSNPRHNPVPPFVPTKE